MFTGHLSHEDFFAQLSLLFESPRQKNHGSVYLTQKPMTYNTTSPAQSKDSLAQDNHPTTPLPIIVRASNGKSKEKKDKKIKLSTIVEADSLEAFFTKYAEVCKGGMSGMKKRDRSKAKEKLKAKKKRTEAAAVVAELKKT
ncbi:signal recognition particle 14kD protein [Blumeria hordei DH14]|uniref:Signal recognition particle subunit SRP14 n=1 Tax=Blumeria graminis f. sp. hordei (strain DH14) TaxID=546991 RepID=N1JB13_BLUG1|nr:signal recognition particle 14kD protein [Blumeria hordei DH14]